MYINIELNYIFYIQNDRNLIFFIARFRRGNMKFTVFKKLILSLMLSVSVLTIYSDAQNITSDKYDLDLNGTKEWVKLYVDRIDQDISIPSYMEIRYNIPTDIVSNIYDGIDIPNDKFTPGDWYNGSTESNIVIENCKLKSGLFWDENSK